MTPSALLFLTFNLAEPLMRLSVTRNIAMWSLWKNLGRTVNTGSWKSGARPWYLHQRIMCFLRKFLDTTVGSTDFCLPKLSWLLPQRWQIYQQNRLMPGSKLGRGPNLTRKAKYFRCGCTLLSWRSSDSTHLGAYRISDPQTWNSTQYITSIADIFHSKGTPTPFRSRWLQNSILSQLMRHQPGGSTLWGWDVIL